jgi:three-Cys-motif partner protein
MGRGEISTTPLLLHDFRHFHAKALEIARLPRPFRRSGRSRIRNSQQIITASPLLALGISTAFDRYIFSELEHENAQALRQRAGVAAPDRDVIVVEGDSNANVESIVNSIPKGSLTFCFVDPFNLKSLRFGTIERLAHRNKMDVLVLVATGMDGTRNESTYTDPDASTVSQTVGNDDWRKRWPQKNLAFGDFIVDEFGRSMTSLGYLYSGLPSTKQIQNGRNAPIYRLAFFSKHSRGDEFWEKCKVSVDPNRRLF